MTVIREVFDISKKIDRRIEKVIFYDSIAEQQLKNEITEYVVTDNISENFENLLDKFEVGLNGGDNYEIGVWVSGFYGSGKSSFTKYLGFALDDSKTLGGEPFLKYLQNQIKSVSLRQRLSTIAKKYPASVFMIDLSTDNLTDATMKEISKVLYSKAISWAGYSSEKKVAYLEFLLEKEEKYEQFKKRITEISNGKTWDQIKDSPLLTKTYTSQLASEFYPHIWADKKSFNEIKIEEMISEGQLIKETLDLIRRKSKKENIIFIIDEVGQYIGARDELILNLDGLAKQIKSLGKGKVWLIATAQQTLTEDNPRAIMNSAKLFKLKDRFPITIDLEASDIKEICWNRLLGKSADGTKLLNDIFDKYGEQSKYSTQLRNTRFYKADLDKTQFQKFYPFLPQHFDILLELLGRLAKTSGGIGLRSAIKVIQDVLVDQSGNRGGRNLLADESLGNLATTVHFYDTLKNDIQRSYKHFVEAVDKTSKIFGLDSFHLKVAKSVAVLQILEDFPVSRENIAALIHPSVDSALLKDQVDSAVSELLLEPSIPISEIDDNLGFMSEAVNKLELERQRIIPQSSERKTALTNLIKDIFTPFPSTNLMGTKKIGINLKLLQSGFQNSIYGEREPIQLMCEFTPTSNYDNRRTELISESQQRNNKYTIYLLGREESDFENFLSEIIKSSKIYSQNKNSSADKEVADYIKGQMQLAQRKTDELKDILKKRLTEGSFVFQGKPQAVGQYSDDILICVNTYLSKITPDVFNKYSEAPINIPSANVEKFLKMERLNNITSELDPLKLVKKDGSIDATNKAIISIKDYLELKGQVDGRALLDDFFDIPYGWQSDTTRYIIAAMLTGGIIKLRYGGQDFTVRGESSISALITTNNFKKIAIGLRDAPTDPETKIRAAERIRDIIGQDVLPLEDNISKAVSSHFPDIASEMASLPTQLSNLDLPGEERAQNLLDSITELLKGDASDATSRLGGKECQIHEDIIWARAVKSSFKNGIGNLIKELKSKILKINNFPNSGVLNKLKSDCSTIFVDVEEHIANDTFYENIVSLQNNSSEIDKYVKETAKEFFLEQNNFVDIAIQKIKSSTDWGKIGNEEQVYISKLLDALITDFSEDLSGLESSISHQYTISTQLKNCETEIRKIIESSIIQPSDINETSYKEIRIKSLPAEISSTVELDQLINDLQNLKEELSKHERIRILWN